MIRVETTVENLGEVLRDAGDTVFADWWARNESRIEKAAEDVIERYGSGYTGREKEGDAVSWAIKEVAGVDVGRETHPGGWADQSEVLGQYPDAVPVLRRVRGFSDVSIHAESMADSYYYVVKPTRTHAGAGRIYYKIGNSAYYAGFVERKPGLEVTAHLRDPFFALMRAYGVEGV